MIFRIKFKRGIFIALATTAICGSAPAKAAIILTGSGIYLPQGDLVGYTFTAVGTAGETINTFTGLTVTAALGGVGVHNVAQAYTNASTPTKQEHTPGLWAADWTQYDTHFLYNAAETLSAGPNFSETNNGATTGTLGLSLVSPNPPTSGFGSYSGSATSAKVILAPNADSSVPFFYVVARRQEPFHMDVRVDGRRSDGSHTFATFDDFIFLYLPIEPEPTTFVLFALAFTGCFGFIRRR